MKKNPVVLIVDDQEVFDLIHPLLKKALNTTNLIHCNTHEDAMNYVASDQQADMIFADWALTRHIFIDGVRSDLENHNTPVVIMSEDSKIKNIALNELESKSTFFLAKPFLKKGFLKKLNKVLDVMEHRRKQRLHPEKNYQLSIEFDDNQTVSLQLVDISIDGCLLRAHIDDSRRFNIYQQTTVQFKIDEFNLPLSGEVYRIGHDRPIPEARDTVLIMIKFGESKTQYSALQEVIDELNQRW